MYTPRSFSTENKEELISFIKKFSFGTIVSSVDESPVASHLPFTLEKKGEQMILSAHFAKANPQWKSIENSRVLVIFSEPHAYVSPSHYDKIESVPTWNYFAVHVYGQARLIADKQKVLQSLENLILINEPAYKKQWDDLSETYKSGMLNGIVPFEITVTKMQASKKMSQNKTAEEQWRIIQTLSASDQTNERQVAEYMKENLHSGENSSGKGA